MSDLDGTIDASLASTQAVSDGGRTMVDPRPPTADAFALMHTAAATHTSVPTMAATAAGRVTVLPRIEGYAGGQDAAGLVSDGGRPRYQRLKMLGAGGMGEVDLAEDNDIGRKVAVKRLLPEATHADGLGRFVEEIRTIGRLEHPNIVPIHDVGLDDQGRYFFIMKYVNGETLETIIEKLNAGDRVYRQRYTFEARIQIFMGLLRALQYAHANGIVHRDLKPANVMVGAYGEVILMDWGIAKAVRDPKNPAVKPDGKPKGDGSKSASAGVEGNAEDKNTIKEPEGRARLYTTRHGSLLGTPAYMSPEQANGHNDEIDERSDVYSASVLFHEFLFLHHYLADRTTLAAMLDGALNYQPPFLKLALASHPHQPPVPAELVHFIIKGMQKDPALRWSSAQAMLSELEGILEGTVRVQCHITFTKRVVREMGRFVDRNPMLAFGILISSFGLMGVAVWRGVQSLIG